MKEQKITETTTHLKVEEGKFAIRSSRTEQQVDEGDPVDPPYTPTTKVVVRYHDQHSATEHKEWHLSLSDFQSLAFAVEAMAKKLGV